MRLQVARNQEAVSQKAINKKAILVALLRVDYRLIGAYRPKEESRNTTCFSLQPDYATVPFTCALHIKFGTQALERTNLF